MSVYQTEEEQVEAIKKWWKENGTSVVAGLVIGLGAVFGWQGWNSYQERIGREASVSFSQLMNAFQNNDLDAASNQAELLRGEYASTSYAVMAAMAQARVKLEQGDSTAARSQLEWAMQNSPNTSLEQLIQLNLARVLLSDGDLDGAAKLADISDGGFAGEYAELRGDIALAKQDRAAAHDAYSQALTLNVANPDQVQMKLDDLAIATN
ncbi:MAG: tetratricopeptide repeat protein [Gammaproteobacteria bacterium]|nr:tetratricopeptide repeat protein [Gammaproteobacteria bacterium]